MADNKIEIEVTADTTQAVGSLGAVEKAAKGVGSSTSELGGNAAGAGKALAQVGQGADGAVTGLGKARAGVQSISEQLSVARTQIASFIAAQLGLSTITSVATTADQFANLQARVKLATGEGKTFTAAFDEVSEIAKRTSSNLEQTGILFTRITESGKSAGLSTAEAVAQSLRLTETINQAVQLSGGSAESSNAAVTQLIQGLQSGVLRGEEFNSVMEQAPRLAKALADGLGVTTGELRKMAEAGTLTADTVIATLKGQADTLKNEFASLPPTLGRAVENLSTSWTLYVGETDKASGASATAASAIKLLSDNLSTVAGYLIDAGQAAAGLAAMKLAQTFFSTATAAAAAGVATAANTAATTGNTAAVTQNALAQQANALTSTAQAAAAARSAGSLAFLSGATQQNTAVTVTNTGAQVANALAAKGVGAGADVAAAGVGRFAAMLGTIKLLSVIGIITNFKDIGTAIGEGAAKLMGYKDRTEELARAEKMQAEIAAENIALRERGQAMLKEAIEKQYELTAAAKTSIAEFDKLTQEGASAAEAIAKIGKDFDLSNMPGIKNAAAVLDNLAADGKISATQFQKAWSDALKGADLAVFEVQARAAFAGTAREAERLAQVMEAALREAVKRTGLDFDVIAGGMGKAARSAINDTQAIITGLDGLKKQGVDTGQVLTASISKSINAADSKPAIDAVKAQIESLRKVLGDKITDGLLDQAKDKALALGDAIDKAKPGINSLREAMNLLGVTSDESLKKTAKTSQEAYDAMKASGTSSTRELADGFRKMATDQLAAAGEVGSSQRAVTEAVLQTEGAVRGLSVSFDENGKLVVQTQAEATAAIIKSFEALNRQQSAVQKVTSALEQQNAAQERVNAAAEKAAELERKRLGVDKEGFSTDKNGSRLVAGGDLTTRTGIKDFLKKAGVNDDAEATRITNEFANSKGEIDYFNNAGQMKYGGASSTISQALLKAAEKYTFAGKPIGGANSAAPPTPGTSPAPTPASSSQTVLVKIDLGGGKSFDVNTASAGDASQLQSFIGALQNAKRAAGM